MISAIVLAAGTSSRMGKENKLLLPYRDTTIIHQTVANICASTAKDIIVVTGFEATKVQQALQNLPVIFAENTSYTTGMTGSIQTGVALAKENGYMICLGDMLHITAEEYNMLAEYFETCFTKDEACICVPMFEQQKGNPVIFSSAYKEQILSHTDAEGCKAIVQNNKAHVYFIDMPAKHILQDVDYPDDYKQLQ